MDLRPAPRASARLHLPYISPTSPLHLPRWTFVQLLVLVLVGLQVIGLWYSVARDRIELRFIEAIVAGRRKDEKRALERMRLARGKVAKTAKAARRRAMSVQAAGAQRLSERRRKSRRYTADLGVTPDRYTGDFDTGCNRRRRSSRMPRASCLVPDKDWLRRLAGSQPSSRRVT